MMLNFCYFYTFLKRFTDWLKIINVVKFSILLHHLQTFYWLIKTINVVQFLSFVYLPKTFYWLIKNCVFIKSLVHFLSFLKRCLSKFPNSNVDTPKFLPFHNKLKLWNLNLDIFSVWTLHSFETFLNAWFMFAHNLTNCTFSPWFISLLFARVLVIFIMSRSQSTSETSLNSHLKNDCWRENVIVIFLSSFLDKVQTNDGTDTFFSV